MDRLTDFLQRFELCAIQVYNGALLHPLEVRHWESVGRFHLILTGTAQLVWGAGVTQDLPQGTVVFCARSHPHRLAAVSDEGVSVLSATINFGNDDENPVLAGLPLPLIVNRQEDEGFASLVALLTTEAQARRCGHAAVLDRLVEALVVKLLRLAIERKMVDRGVVAGLGDARLAKTLVALHSHPQAMWTLESMAREAGMSRSRFAALFSRVMGVPAAEYLKRWRIGLAKQLLRSGKPVKAVALEVGYGSSAAFGRAFGQIEGVLPSAWLARAAIAGQEQKGLDA